MKFRPPLADGSAGGTRVGADPRVSVIVPAYNTSSWIAKTLDSIFSQTLQNFEVVVVNDGSPDSEELERVLQPYFGAITYLQQPNRGPAAARNAGILRTNAEYIAFLDSDDTWDTEFLHAQLALLQSGEGADLVFANLRMVGPSPRAGRTYMEDCPSRGRATFESILREECQIPNSAVVARRRVLVEAGLFDESPRLRGTEDWDMWLRAAWLGARIVYGRAVLGTYRLRANSLSADRLARLAAAAHVLNKLDGQLELSPRQHVMLHRKKADLEARAQVIRGKDLLSQGEFDRARDCLQKAYDLSGSLKVLAAIGCLRVAPDLAKAGATNWDRMLQRRLRARSGVKNFHDAA
jgi:GT2 family glycosyltransferase